MLTAGRGCRERHAVYDAQQHFEEVPLHVRVDIALERSGANKALDVFTSILSFVTVLTYIVFTYGDLDSSLIDLCVGSFFAAEWLFRAWKSASRLAFIFSWWSLADVLTFVPMLVLNGMVSA